MPEVVIEVPDKAPVKVPPAKFKYLDDKDVPFSCKLVVALIVVPVKVFVRVPPVNVKYLDDKLVPFSCKLVVALIVVPVNDVDVNDKYSIPPI